MDDIADAQTRRAELPIAGRSMDITDLRHGARAEPGDAAADAPLVTARLVFSAGAMVKRYDWMRERYYNEQLVVSPSSVRMARMERGAPLLNTHSAYDLGDVLGVVDSPEVIGNRAECNVTFSRREDVAGYVRDVIDGIIRNVSVGYIRHRIEMDPPEAEGGVWTYRVTDWEPMEVSLVPIPADMDAQIRSGGIGGPDRSEPGAADQPAVRTYPCEFIETRSHNTSASTDSPAVGPTTETVLRKEPTMTPEELAAQAAAAQAEQARQADIANQAAIRAADIAALCQRHNVAELSADLIRSGKSVAEAGHAVLEELARRDAAQGGHQNTRVQTVRDEVQTRLSGMEEAILARVDARAKLTDNGRAYRGLSLLEMGREYLQSRGVDTRGMDKLRLASEMLSFRAGGSHTTSDFTSLMANVANKRLRNAYDENPGTYAIWARRAPNAPDFKNISVVQLSGAPDLLRTNEHAEFTYGTMTDGAESYSVITYGRIVSLTRQAIVNDDLRGFDRLITAYGAAARRLENKLVYSQLTANAALADGGNLFNATAVTTAGGHANLATGAGSALQMSSLTTGRTAMRVQKGYQGEELNVVPAYLITPAALEQTAYQLTSNVYVPATKAEINEFREGGRTALTPVIEPLLDASSATAWYLAAANTQVDTVEYCYLDGAEGPVIESEMGFEVDGTSWKCRLDFAAKAIDFRGLYKANGA